MEYTIREIRPEERGLLDDFLYEAIFLPDGQTAPDRDIIKLPELQVYVEHFGQGPADLCMLAESGGKVIGAAWSRIMDDYGHIDDDTPSLAVSPLKEYRGFGIGTALMQNLLETLRGLGFRQVSLSVQKANYAVRLYEKLGFTILRESGEELVMVKELK